MTTPNRNNDYQAPTTPVVKLTRELWNAVFGDIAARLNQREALEASFELLQNEGIQASLDYIQATLAPQIAALVEAINAAQDQIDTIINEGIAPDSEKLGGELPSHFATVSALVAGLAAMVPNSRTINGKPLSADITLAREDVGLGSVNNTSDADKPISAETAAALATKANSADVHSKSVSDGRYARVDGGNVGPLGYRNWLCNGNMSIWQRSENADGGGYTTADRWFINASGAQVNTRLARGTTGPYERLSNGSALRLEALTADDNVGIFQLVEGVRSLSGGKATYSGLILTNEGKQFMFQLRQKFGSGGSADVILPPQTITVTSEMLDAERWFYFQVTFDLPTVTGKTIGTNGDDYLSVQIVNPLLETSITWFADLQLEAGSIATPFERRPRQIEQLLCERYYRAIPPRTGVYANNSTGTRTDVPLIPPMRTAPSLTRAQPLTSGLGGFTNGQLPTLNAAQKDYAVLQCAGTGMATGSANSIYTSAPYTTPIAFLDAELPV